MLTMHEVLATSLALFLKLSNQVNAKDAAIVWMVRIETRIQ